MKVLQGHTCGVLPVAQLPHNSSASIPAASSSQSSPGSPNPTNSTIKEGQNERESTISHLTAKGRAGLEAPVAELSPPPRSRDSPEGLTQPRNTASARLLRSRANAKGLCCPCQLGKGRQQCPTCAGQGPSLPGHRSPHGIHCRGKHSHVLNMK